jgi:hypothetical protein
MLRLREFIRESEAKYLLSASHPTGKGRRLHAKAYDHDDVHRLIRHLRQEEPDHQVSIQNNHTGMVHTVRGHHFDPRTVDL